MPIEEKVGKKNRPQPPSYVNKQIPRSLAEMILDLKRVPPVLKQLSLLVSGQVNFVGICKGTARRAPTKNQAPVPANFVLTAH
jgi:hypothetical protein